MAKEGSTVSGLMDTIATMTSISLQYGVPLKALVDKFSHTRFEPSGFTNNKQIPIAKSVTDYVFRYLGNRYLEVEEPAEVSDETGTAIPISIGVSEGVSEGVVRGRVGVRNGDAAPRCRCGCGWLGRHDVRPRGPSVEHEYRFEFREPGGCAFVHGLRLDHDSQWRLLQMPELRKYERL